MTKLGWRVGSLVRLLEQPDAEQRREQHGDEPGDDQRDRHHGEDRERVFAGGAAGEADRHEAGDGDERAGQHRQRQRLVGEGRGLFLAVALGEARRHHVDRRHRVVDEQAQRNDERAERDALQVDMHRLHDRKHDRDRQRNRQRHHRARPQAEADDADRHDDGDRLPERLHEFADRGLDDDRLVGDERRRRCRAAGWRRSRRSPFSRCGRAPGCRRRRAWRWRGRSPACR